MRLRRILVSPELLFLLCRNDCGPQHVRIQSNGLPDDATLCQVTIDPMSGCIQLFVCSAEFDEVDQGRIPPEHPAPIFERLEA